MTDRPIEAATLHQQIMNLPCNVPDPFSGDTEAGYRLGHRDARHAAAELVLASAPPQPVIGSTGADWIAVGPFQCAGGRWEPVSPEYANDPDITMLYRKGSAPAAATVEVPDPDIVVTDTGTAWNWATNKEVEGERFYSESTVRAMLAGGRAGRAPGAGGLL